MDVYFCGANASYLNKKLDQYKFQVYLSKNKEYYFCYIFKYTHTHPNYSDEVIDITFKKYKFNEREKVFKFFKRFEKESNMASVNAIFNHIDKVIEANP